MSKQTDLINIPDAITVDGSNNVGIGTSSPSFESGAGTGLEISNASGNGAHVKLTDSASGSGGTNGFDLYAFNTNGYIENYEAGSTIFRNNGNERLRIDSDGLKFNGDTAAANALDDYEEGTWTVNLTKGGSALPVNTRYAYYTRVGNLIYLSFYWFHNGGLSSETNNSTQYKVIGLPYALQAGISAAYAGIGSTYVVVNGNNVANDYYHKWQVNATDKLSLTGHAQSTQHSSGVLELSGSGVFRI